MELRPYQTEAVDEILDLWKRDYDHLMLQMPTGSGKTEIMIGIIQAIMALHDNNARFVILAHRDVLVKQTAKRVNDAGIQAVAAIGQEWPPRTQMPESTVVVTTPTLLKNRKALEHINESWYLLVDEAHHAPASIWAKIILNFPGMVLGVTATPWRLTRKEGFEELFDYLICGPQISELVAKNYLSAPRTIVADPKTRIVGGSSRQGDFTTAGIMKDNDDTILTDKAIEWWLKVTRGNPQSIFYAVTTTHAHQLREILEKHGVPTHVVLQDTTEAEREEIVTEFRNKTCRVIVNVTIMTEGVDFPEAECVVLLRPTKSLALYMQMIGRIMRIQKGSRKIIMDATDNVLRHGLPTQERKWSLAARGTDGEGAPPLKRCVKCEEVLYISTQVCPCGHEFGKDCPQCGRWNTWEKCTFDDKVCNRCYMSQFRDANAQSIAMVDDGWSISRKGHPYLTDGNQKATLFKVPESDQYIAYTSQGKIHIGAVDENVAKRIVEAELGIMDSCIKVIRECRILVKDAIDIANKEDPDHEEATEWLNMASATANAMKIKTFIKRADEQKAKQVSHAYERLQTEGKATRDHLLAKAKP